MPVAANKIEIIGFLDKQYKNINLSKLALLRFKESNNFTLEIAKYIINADKMNLFLVFFGARERVPVYVPVPKSVTRFLKLKSIGINSNLKKELSSLCAETVTKKTYEFSNKLFENLCSLPITYDPFGPLGYLPFDPSKYNKKLIDDLSHNGYIIIKQDVEVESGNKKYLILLTEKAQNIIDISLGELFNYPKCCIKAFIEKRTKPEVKDKIEMTVNFNDVPQYQKFGLLSDFLPYEKCSENCKKSQKLVAAIKEYIRLKETTTEHNTF